MRILSLVAIIALGVVANLPARADTVTYNGYPAPGGNTYTFVSGSGAIDSGGITHQYGGFNPSAYTNLYWVVDTVAGAPYLGQSSSDTLSFDSSHSNLPGGVLVFDGSYSASTASGPSPYFGELKVTVTNAATLSPSSLDSPSLHTGIPVADGGALNVTGAYDVNLQFLMGPNSSSLTDAAGYYNSLSPTGGDGSLLASVYGGFYSTAPVPLPASAWLLLSALGGLGFLVRKRPGGAMVLRVAA
jgi:hypothetical protein